VVNELQNFIRFNKVSGSSMMPVSDCELLNLSNWKLPLSFTVEGFQEALCKAILDLLRHIGKIQFYFKVDDRVFD